MRRTTACIAVMVGALALVATASATPFAPYDGSNPFRCKVQNVGTGVDFPDPNADPFCVEFDKTNENVTDFGIVDFLLNEPARVAAATTKCFYHQTDHWTGSIVQGTEPTLWHWDGSYFFDKARGMGGVRVDNLVVGGPAGRSAAATGVPGPVHAVLRARRRWRIPQPDGAGGPELRSTRRYPAGSEQDLPRRLAVSGFGVVMNRRRARTVGA